MSILGVPAAAPSISGRPETLEARNGGAAGLFRGLNPWKSGNSIQRFYFPRPSMSPDLLSAPPWHLPAPARLLGAAGKSRAMKCLRIDRTVPHGPPQVSSPGSGHEVGWQNSRHLPEKRCFRDEVRWQSSLEPASVYHYEAGWQRLPAEKCLGNQPLSRSAGSQTRGRLAIPPRLPGTDREAGCKPALRSAGKMNEVRWQS